jgi:3-oxoacyl-[acyl-carrier protein] reductase
MTLSSAKDRPFSDHSNAKTVLVTGASRGLGLEIVEQLLQRGDQVIAVSRTQSESLQRLSENSGDRLRFVCVDLKQTSSLRMSLFEQIPADIQIDGLVNNAAVGYDDLATNLRLDALKEMFHVNVFSAMELSRFVVRRMLVHRRGGSLVHISSISTRAGYRGLSMYAATKGALEAFSIGLSREWGSLGIRSNCVAPGFMETEMTSSLTDLQRERIYQRNSLREAQV